MKTDWEFLIYSETWTTKAKLSEYLQLTKTGIFSFISKEIMHVLIHDILLAINLSLTAFPFVDSGVRWSFSTWQAE